MGKRDLDAEVRRKGRREAEFTITADPNNIPELRSVLSGYLSGEGWHEDLWSQFDMLVRFSGEHKVRRMVRT